MNMKKIVAGVAASALAVSAMAVAASAADFKTEYQVKQYAEKLNTIDDGFYSQIQIGHIQKIDSLTIEYQTADGATGYALVSTNWGNDDPVEANNFKWDGGSFQNWTGAALTLPEGVAVEGTILTCTLSTDVASEWETYIATYPDAAAAATPDMMLMTFGANSDGAIVILAEFAEEAAPAETTAAAADNTPAETTAAAAADNTSAETTAAAAGNTTPAASSDKGNADTGVEGVAVVAGLAIVAAGAIVVAKKRK